jgi:hypothetical protein
MQWSGKSKEVREQRRRAREKMVSSKGYQEACVETPGMMPDTQ